MSVEVWANNSKITRHYVLIMIYKSFYKCEARAENYDKSHWYAYYDPKTENNKYLPISHTSCVYCGSNDLAPDTLQYQGNLAQTGKVWSI